ncbi:MAG: DUF2520 domain-containing protein [Rikenellaceae bacterium]|nr:DUF2520 domain-containing protein [Rikenellaceae bacterium]
MERVLRIVIIGSGHVAEVLVRAFSEADGVRLCQLFSRNAQRGKALASVGGCPWEDRPSMLAQADVYILAVSDRAIGEVSAELPLDRGLVVHTSGSCLMEEISCNVARRGVFYPLQTFTAGREVEFREIPLFIEAEHGTDYSLLEALGSRLCNSVYRSDAALRRKMHIAAVFVCNFVNHLYAVGEQWMSANGMDFSVLKPLIAETTRKMLESHFPRTVQTGPAMREDYPTLEKHMQELIPYPQLQEIYRILTEHIIHMKSTDGKL